MSEQEVLVDIRERLVRVETKIDNQNGIREKLDIVEGKLIENEQRSKSNADRIEKLEANNIWLWRTIAGAIITAILAVLLRGG